MIDPAFHACRSTAQQLLERSRRRGTWPRINRGTTSPQQSPPHSHVSITKDPAQLYSMCVTAAGSLFSLSLQGLIRQTVWMLDTVSFRQAPSSQKSRKPAPPFSKNGFRHARLLSAGGAPARKERELPEQSRRWWTPLPARARLASNQGSTFSSDFRVGARAHWATGCTPVRRSDCGNPLPFHRRDRSLAASSDPPASLPDRFSSSSFPHSRSHSHIRQKVAEHHHVISRRTASGRH